MFLLKAAGFHYFDNTPGRFRVITDCSYSCDEVPDIVDKLFGSAVADLDHLDASPADADFLKERIHRLGAFPCAKISLEIPAFAPSACYNHDTVGARLKSFYQIEHVNLAGTGEADGFDLLADIGAEVRVDIFRTDAGRTVEQIYFQRFALPVLSLLWRGTRATDRYYFIKISRMIVPNSHTARGRCRNRAYGVKKKEYDTRMLLYRSDGPSSAEPG